VINESMQDAANHDFSEWTTGDKENWKIRQFTRWEGSHAVMCLSPLGQEILAWDSILYYDSNRVYGTDGSTFQRPLEKGGNLYAFVDVLYREVTIVNVDDLEVSFKGINLLRYVIPANLMQNASLNPTNAAYYAFGDSGVLNLTHCSEGADIFISKPHFLDLTSSTNTTGKIVGLNPNRDLHDTFLDVEPTSGLTMHAAKRLQINSLTQPVKQPGSKPPFFPNLLPLLYVPVVWIEEGAEIKDSDADDFKNGVIFVQNLNYYLFWVGYVVGFTFIGLGAIGLARKAWILPPAQGNINEQLLG